MKAPINCTESELKEFWENWLGRFNREEMEEDKDLFVERSVYDLMKVAIENKQYATEKEFVETKRVVKFRINMPRDAMKKSLGIDTWSIYGIGLFTLIDGVFVAPSSREKSGYDKSGRGRRFDLDFVPEEIRNNFEFRLAIPAIGGLFVPKKSPLTSWMSSIRQLEYFDLTI